MIITEHYLYQSSVLLLQQNKQEIKKNVCVFVPEGEENEACDDEDGSKNDEDVVTGVSPPSIVEHLCRLSKGKKRECFTNKQIYIDLNITVSSEAN